MDLVCGAEGKQAANGGPLSPDQIVYCKSFPLWFEPDAEKTSKRIVERLGKAIADHTAANRFPPTIVLVKGVGHVCRRRRRTTPRTRSETGLHRCDQGHGRSAGDWAACRYLAADFRTFIENWEVESYRKSVSLAKSAGGRTAGKIAVITGHCPRVWAGDQPAVRGRGRHRGLDRHERRGREQGRGRSVGAKTALAEPSDWP